MRLASSVVARRCYPPIVTGRGSHQRCLTTTNRFQTNKHLQRARIKGELKPMLSLAIHSFLTKKQEQLLLPKEDNEPTKDFAPAVELLARWNGFQPIDPSRLLVTKHFQGGRLHLGQGLVAEASAFAAENYTVWARPCTHDPEQHHPPFCQEDYSWYRTLEARVNDNLDRWEENARKRRQQRLHTAKQGLQRIADKVQVPLAKSFGVVTAKLGPIADQVRATVKSNWKQALAVATGAKDKQNMAAPAKDLLPEEWKTTSSTDEEEETTPKQDERLPCTMDYNEEEPEDLIVLSKEGGSFLLLTNVHPIHRLLALPVVTATNGKAKPPYRLRLARGGLVITVSIIMLGALPPAYRSLRFILEYPKTAEIVMITLVASITYNMWSWATNARTRQRELISAAIQSRLIAKEEAALAFLTVDAVNVLTETLMESYCCLLFNQSSDVMDPLVAEIGQAVGLFHKPKRRILRPGLEDSPKEAAEESQIGAVEWDKARAALVHSLAVRM